MADATRADDSGTDLRSNVADVAPRATNEVRTEATGERSLRWGASLLVLAGAGLVLNGLVMLYRALYTAGFEAGVATLDGLTHAELAAEYHEVAHYVDHLHVNVAGLLVAVGLGVAALAWFGVRRGERWALGTAVAMPAAFLLHSLPIHHSAEFGFEALAHLGPGFLWVPTLLVGAALAYRGTAE